MDFACKKINVLDVVKCSLGLSKSEVIILKFLVKHSGEYYSTEDVCDELKFEKSTVQKCVKKLYDSNVLLKRQKNLDGGGYEFEYSSIEVSKVREIILGNINLWVSRIEKELCKFD